MKYSIKINLREFYCHNVASEKGYVYISKPADEVVVIFPKLEIWRSFNLAEVKNLDEKEIARFFAAAAIEEEFPSAMAIKLVDDRLILEKADAWAAFDVKVTGTDEHLPKWFIGKAAQNG